VTTRSYGQFCGFARSLELVGERWALLVVRDLVLGPKRFTDLRRGLPRIPTNILSARLKELEDAGIVRRRLLPRPAAGVAYELSEYGQELEDIVLRMGLWGARSLGNPRPEDIVTTDSLILALRATFRPEPAGDLRASYELRIGPVVVHASLDRGILQAGEGPLAEPDLVIETQAAFRPLLAGELSPEDAIESGGVRLTGDPSLLTRFVDAFRIPPSPGRATMASDPGKGAALTPA
jgi:DNA-binding HxlR family transcriptional regulator